MSSIKRMASSPNAMRTRSPSGVEGTSGLSPKRTAESFRAGSTSKATSSSGTHLTAPGGGYSSPPPAAMIEGSRRAGLMSVEDIMAPKTAKGQEAERRRQSKAKENRVQVAVRVRPMTKADGGVADRAVTTDGDCGITICKMAGEGGSETEKKFTYDHVFENDQLEVYDCIGRPMILDALEGFNVTLFAYGQTGSGKTYSIQGETVEGSPKAGIVPRFCSDLLSLAQKNMENDPTLFIKISMSMIELYNEKVRDLMERRKPGQQELTELDLHEDKNKRVFVGGLSTNTVTSYDRLLSLIQTGLSNRQMHETNMNATSSRSHTIVQLFITQTHDPPRADARDVESIVNIVDLAGSERQSKTQATGDRFEEAKKINHSLLMLGRALNTFADGKADFVPLRESKLTRLLSESFGGNARTWMLACCSPSTYNYTETMSTLQYAQNAKSIINKAKINAMAEKLELKQLKIKYQQLEELYDKEREKCKQLQFELQDRAETIQRLQQELRAAKSGSTGSPASWSFTGDTKGNYFIGRAHLSLRNIIQLSSNYVTLPLVTDLPDCDGAMLMVSTYPLRKYQQQQGEDGNGGQSGVALEDLLGKRIDLIVHVIAAKNIPAQYNENVFCKYVFKHAEKDVYQTEAQTGCDIEFDFKKRYAFGSLTQQLADYLTSPNVLTFEVIGERVGLRREGGSSSIGRSAASPAAIAPHIESVAN